MAATVAYHRSTDAVLSSPQGTTLVKTSTTTHASCTGCCYPEDPTHASEVKNSALPSSTASSSRAMTVLTAVERSVLRTLAFVFYQLDREQAKYCASSILRWYFQLQAQLPVSAVESLERVAESVIALSDAKFTSFWLSLLEKEIELSDAEDELLESRITIQSYAEYEHEVRGQDELQTREKTLIKRLYQHIYCSIRSLFFSASRSSTADRKLATQTPCTSPIDLPDDSHYQKHSRRKHSRFIGHKDDETDECYRDHHYSDGELFRHNSYDNNSVGGDHYDHDDSDEDSSDEDDVFEPGWAVEYMEQESTQVSTELSRRMRKMMHSSIPLNLFRVTVAYSSDRHAEEAGEGGFVGVISPESFPPTPITRDLQTRRMNCYTVSVLDHATLALRLLEANCNSTISSNSSYPQHHQLR